MRSQVLKNRRFPVAFAVGSRRIGKPMEMGSSKSLNDELYDECLNANHFLSVDDAKRKIAPLRIDYKLFRPHSSSFERT
jgi:hypothetical protein